MNSLGLPTRLGSLVLVLAALLVGAALPASASAASEEGGGVLKASPDPIAVPTTTAGFQSVAETVTLAYEGEGTVQIEKIGIEGEDSGEFFFNGSSCGTLGDGGSCQVWLGLKPTSPGLKQATLVVHYGGGRPDDSFTLSGRGAAPSLSFVPGSHDFGLQRINRESVSYEFTLENSGEAGVDPSGFDTDGPGSEAFWIGNTSCWTWLEPGESCSLQVWFNPHSRGAFEAQARAWVNGDVFGAAISGEGGAAQVEALQNPVGFGTATAGGAGAVRTITLRNVGDLPEFFFIGVLAGGDASSFRLLDEGCTLIELAPGESCSAHVRFAPDGPGPKAARLAFFGDGEGGTLVQVEGEGLAATASLLPGGFDFGALAAGARSAAHSFLVRNDGAAPLALDRVALVGADVDQFALSGDECTGAELAPGAGCAISVRFVPDGSGARRATLRVSGPSATLTASLAGTAAGAATEAGAAQPASSDPAAPRRARRRDRFVRGETLDARRARFLHAKDKQGKRGKHGGHGRKGRASRVRPIH